MREEMDNAVWGHDNAKHQILQIMGQSIRNPKSKGSVLGIWGPPGNGKTNLIKEGIAKAMNKPFVFIFAATDALFIFRRSFFLHMKVLYMVELQEELLNQNVWILLFILMN